MRLVTFRYFRLELLKEAETVAKSLNTLKPELIAAHFILAEIYLKQQKTDQSRHIMEKSLSYCDDYYGTYHILGKIYHKQREFRLALAAYRKAEQLNPTLYQAQLEMAYVLYEQGGWREATEKCLKILRIKPQLAEAHQLLGMAYGCMGDHLDAHRHLSEALALRPNDPDLLFNLGVTLFKMDEYSQASQYFMAAQRQL